MIQQHLAGLAVDTDLLPAEGHITLAAFGAANSQVERRRGVDVRVFGEHQMGTLLVEDNGLDLAREQGFDFLKTLARSRQLRAGDGQIPPLPEANDKTEEEADDGQPKADGGELETRPKPERLGARVVCLGIRAGSGPISLGHDQPGELVPVSSRAVRNGSGLKYPVEFGVFHPAPPVF